MEFLNYDTFINAEFDTIKEALKSVDEDQSHFELMKLAPKIINNFYSFKNPELVHKLCSICQWLQIERGFDECKILNILEDVLTCMDSCALPEFLKYLESVTQNIKRKENENKCKSIVLRICNALLKRLGKIEHKVVRGNLQRTVANCMGIVTERSGVNFRGQISVRKFKQVAICDSLYSRVCQTLICAKDPFGYIRHSSKLDRMIENLEKLLEELSEIQTTNRNLAQVTLPIEHHYFCTNPIEEIFDLQIKDKSFMVYFISSILLMCQTITKPATKAQETSIVLSDLQKPKILLITSKCQEILLKENPGYLASFNSLLKNEESWVNWKYNKCLGFEKRSFDEFPTEVQVELEDGEVESEEVVHDKPQALFEPSESEPCLENFVKKVLIDLDPDEGIEDEYKSVNDPVFSWRFLRMVSFKNISEFEKGTTPNIESIAKKLAGFENKENGREEKEVMKGEEQDNEEPAISEENGELPVKRSSSLSSSGSKRSKV